MPKHKTVHTITFRSSQNESEHFPSSPTIELTMDGVPKERSEYERALFDLMGDRWIDDEELKNWQILWELAKKEKDNE